MPYKHAAKKTAYNRAYYQKRGASIKSRLNVSRYGITLADYDRMLVAQNNKCAICFEPFTDTPHIDHDHDTKHVRGLLCLHCNVGIGRLKDDIAHVGAALSYLQAHQRVPQWIP